AHGAMHAHHHHGEMGGAGVPPIVAMLVFVSSWTLMTIAMMLPTILPVIAAFDTVAQSRRNRPLLVALVVAGYLAAWALFGALVHLGQAGLRQLADAGRWMDGRAWTTAILMIAGVYQFTPLKHRCLEKCRSPLSFVME